MSTIKAGIWASCVAALVMPLLLTGCTGQDSKAILDLVPLALKLEAEVDDASVVVGLDDRDTLGVTVSAAASNGLTQGEVAEQARRIAAYVCESYDSIGEISQVSVRYEIRQDRFIVDGSHSATYVFETSELGCER